MTTLTRWRAALVARARSVPADLWLLAALLVPLVALRLTHAAALPDLPEDGTWLEVARSVRDGDGLVSWTVAPYPGPSPLPPGWPVLLGAASRVLDLADLARWLPVALASGSLVLAGWVGRRLWPEPVAPELVPALNGGHL